MPLGTVALVLVPLVPGLAIAFGVTQWIRRGWLAGRGASRSAIALVVAMSVPLAILAVGKLGIPVLDDLSAGSGALHRTSAGWVFALLFLGSAIASAPTVLAGLVALGCAIRQRLLTAAGRS